MSSLDCVGRKAAASVAATAQSLSCNPQPPTETIAKIKQKTREAMNRPEVLVKTQAYANQMLTTKHSEETKVSHSFTLLGVPTQVTVLFHVPIFSRHSPAAAVVRTQPPELAATTAIAAKFYRVRFKQHGYDGPGLRV